MRINRTLGLALTAAVLAVADVYKRQCQGYG